MSNMHLYFIEKLSEINYRMAMHEGNANARLAREARKIRLLPSSVVPEKFKNKYLKLIELIENEIKKLHNSNLELSKFPQIQNRTALKYIQLLYDMEVFLKD